MVVVITELIEEGRDRKASRCTDVKIKCHGALEATLWKLTTSYINGSDVFY